MIRAVSRREVCCGLLGAGAFLLPYKAVAEPVHTFCTYSLTDGWSDDEAIAKEYVTHQARPNDRSGVPQVVDRIKGVLSFRTRIDIYIAEREDNASAMVANGQRLLVVDVGFLEKLNRYVGTEWGAIQVIAHEVGHHIAGFSDDRHRSELNADYWSGQALQRLGSARDAATKAILTVGTESDTPSHPNKYSRAEVIARGWEDASAGRIDYSFCIDCR